MGKKKRWILCGDGSIKEVVNVDLRVCFSDHAQNERIV